MAFIYRFLPGRPDRPILLLLHGTGGTEEDLLDVGKSLVPGAALLSPRGQTLENGRPRFFRRLSEGVFDEKDLIMRTHELADFVEAAQVEYGVEGRSIVAVGYSNGANIAGSLLLLRPNLLAGAVLLRPMVPLNPQVLPGLEGKKILISSGLYDPIIDPENPRRLAKIFKDAGADVMHHWTDGGHELHSVDFEEAVKWLTLHFAELVGPEN